MDALARLLDAPRGRDAYLVRTTVEPPWSLRLADGAPLGLIAVRRGSVWVSADEGDPVELSPGAIAVAKGSQQAVLADRPLTGRTAITLLPGMRLVDQDGREIGDAWTLGHRHLGNDIDGSAELLMGCYQLRGEVTELLLSALPPVVLLPPGQLDTPLLSLLADEIVKDAPGQSAVLDRLFDLLLVAVLREWATGQGTEGRGPYVAQADPVIGPVLRTLHKDPANGWTLAGLASLAGVSRSTFAHRFTSMVGQSPMAYLTGWRMALAADLLREPTSTVERVAREVGYGSGFALSAAFTRERGITPSEHRARSAAAPTDAAPR